MNEPINKIAMDVLNNNIKRFVEKDEMGFLSKEDMKNLAYLAKNTKERKVLIGGLGIVMVGQRWTEMTQIINQLNLNEVHLDILDDYIQFHSAPEVDYGAIWDIESKRWLMPPLGYPNIDPVRGWEAIQNSRNEAYLLQLRREFWHKKQNSQ